jgi:hypothetical protein
MTHSLRVGFNLVGFRASSNRVPSPNLEAKPQLRDKVPTFEPQEAIKISLNNH